MTRLASAKFSLILCGLWLNIACLAHSPDRGYILLTNGDKIVSNAISADDAGNIFYQSDAKELIVPASMVKMVKIKRPLLLRRAAEYESSGELQSALKAYRQVAHDYRFLGWAEEALVAAGQILRRQGKNDAALTQLKPLLKSLKTTKTPPSTARLTAWRTGCEIYLEQQEYAKSLKLLDLLKGSGNSQFAAWAFRHSGKLYMAQKDYRAAAREFIQGIELFQGKERQDSDEYHLLLECLAEFDKKLTIFHLKRLKKVHNDSTLQECSIKGSTE